MDNVEIKVTTGQGKSLNKAQKFLRDALEKGKEAGNVSLDASLELRIDPEEEGPGGIALYLGGGRKKRPVYVVSIPSGADMNWDTIRHEAGHVYLGHPEKSTPSGAHFAWGDFPSFLDRELKAEFSSREGTEQVPYLYKDLTVYVRGGVQDFGLSPEESFEAVKDAARRVGIPYQHIKKARRQLEEEGFLE